MALDLVEIRMILSGGKQVAAEADAASASIAGTGKAAKAANEASAASAAKASKSMKSLGRGLRNYVTLPILGISALAGKFAVDFDRSMRNVNSIAQLPEQQFKHLKKSVLDLAGPTAQAPNTLAEGMYDLVSSGFDAKESLTILKSSALAASAGLTTTEVSTKAVAAALNAYELPASQAANVSDILFETVNRGVLTFDELSTTIGDVLPFSSQLGINLAEVGASISTMTKQGLSSAEAVTRLKNTMIALIKPSKPLKEMLHEMGISGEELVKKKGFQGALESIVKHTDGTKEAIAELFPNIRGMGGVLALTGSKAKMADEDVSGFNDTAGATAKVLKEQEKSVGFKLQRAWSEMQKTLIEFGEALIPIVIPALEKLSSLIQGISEIFKNMSPSMKSAAGILLATAAAVGPAILLGGKLSTLGTSLKGGLTGSGLGGRLGVASVGFGASQAAGGAIGGDLGNWVSKAGAGASAGFAVGGPFGALAGGAIGGGIAAYEKLFGVQRHLTWSQRQLARDSKAVAAGMNAQRAAGASLAGAGQRLARSHKRVEKTSDGLHRAERRLTNAYKNGHGDRRTVLRDEQRITISQHNHVEAVRKLHRAEKLSKVAASQYKTIARANILEERNEINVLSRKHAALDTAYTQSVRNHEGLKKQNELAQRAQGVEGKLTEAHKKMATTLEETTNKIGPGYSRWLEHATQEMLNFGSALKAAEESIGTLGESLPAGSLGPLGQIVGANPIGGTGNRLSVKPEKPKKHGGAGSNGNENANARHLHATILLPNGRVLGEVTTKATEDAKARL